MKIYFNIDHLFYFDRSLFLSEKDSMGLPFYWQLKYYNTGVNIKGHDYIFCQILWLCRNMSDFKKIGSRKIACFQDAFPVNLLSHNDPSIGSLIKATRMPMLNLIGTQKEHKSFTLIQMSQFKLDKNTFASGFIVVLAT